MQDTIKINGVEIFQPDEGLGYGFETTYSEDSGRVQTGSMHAVSYFAVEQFSYEATEIPMEKATEILQMIARGNPFTLHYYSIFYGAWRDGLFRVGKGSLNIGTLEEGYEKLSSLSFNMTGEEPI